MRILIALALLAPLPALAQDAPSAEERRVPIAPTASAADAQPPVELRPAAAPAPRPPFRPEASAFGFFVRAGADVVTDRSFDLVASGDALPRVEVGAELQSDLLARHLGFEVAYQGGGTSAPLHGVGDASLAVNTVHAAAVYRRVVAPLLAVTARLGVGLDVSNLTLGRDSDGSGGLVGGALSDSALTVGALGALGVEAMLPFGGGDPRRQHVAVGLDLGRNQRFSAARFDGLQLDAERSSDTPAPVGGGPVDVGDLDLSAWTWRLSLALRF